MGMMIGSMNSNKQVITLKRADGTVAGRITKTGGNRRKTPQKLNYNYKQVSARILMAKTSGNAGQTVLMARAKLAQLRQKVKGRGDYDDEELAAAIIHAEKMVRIAKKKQRHLKAEENAQKEQNSGTDTASALQDQQEEQDGEMKAVMDLTSGDSKLAEEKIERQMEQMERLMEAAMRAADRLGDLDELSEEFLEEETDPEELQLRKKKHRADELREITEADMKYLKAMFNKLQREKQNASSGVKSAGTSNAHESFGGVSLEIGGVEMPVAEGDMAVAAEGGNLDVSV